jgi:hypothetical protein
MSARRPPWLWWGAGALFLIVIAGWVFWASQRERRFKPLSNLGPANLPTGFSPGDLPAPAGLPRSKPGVGIDPRLQQTLQTVNEINRLNQINADMRRTPNRPSPPTPPLPPLPEPAGGESAETP